MIPESEKNQPVIFLQEKFHEHYGSRATHIFRAPARINILGEHIDYVTYLPTASLPFGSNEHAMTMLVRANDTGMVRGASLHKAFASFEFSLHDRIFSSDKSWHEYVVNRPVPVPHWSNYAQGAVFFALQKCALQNPSGFDFLIHSTIPPQGGSSSSSALVVLAGAAFRAVNNINYSLPELAQDSAQAEWFVGTRGGAMDHTTICLAQRNHVLHLEYANQQAALMSLPSADFRWVTFFTHAADKGKEIMLEYNERAAVARIIVPALLEKWKVDEPQIFRQWHEAKAFLQAEAGTIVALEKFTHHHFPRALALAETRTYLPAAWADCERVFPSLVKERWQQSLKIRPRVLHHLGEIQRVRAALTILSQSCDEQIKMQKLGALLTKSHASLRDLYEVSTPQVNQLHEILQQESLTAGARLIGGGFGGNVLALTTEKNVRALVAHVQQEFYAPQKRDGVNEGAIMISTPGAGITKALLP